jgi:2-dehydro-3-deoxyphosphooctonate aldolase (KDO 8-P synthase)
MKIIKLNTTKIGGNNPLIILAGPCVVENESMIMQSAEYILNLSRKIGFNFVFKSSYKKANRSSVDSFTTIGEDEALNILAKVKSEFGLSIITDIHSPEEASRAAEVADILQIPAFLCRQTDLLIAAGKTGKIVNIKKGQFLAPNLMKNAADKVASTGNDNIMLTERGTFFGYNDLVVDMRSLVIMKESGYPVIYDATHSVQQPGKGNISGGQPQFIFPLVKAAVATGVSGVFIETHPDPKNAMSDAESQLPLDQLESLLTEILKIDNIVKENRES